MRTFLTLLFLSMAASAAETTLQPLVTAESVSSPRNDYTGWVGCRMTFQTNFCVNCFGTKSIAGNTTSHRIRWYQISKLTGTFWEATVDMGKVTDGRHVFGSITEVTPSNGGAMGNTTNYTAIESLQCEPGFDLYCVMEVTSGSDSFYDSTVSIFGSDASSTGLVWTADPANTNGWNVCSFTNVSYGPVNALISKP